MKETVCNQFIQVKELEEYEPGYNSKNVVTSHLADVQCMEGEGQLNGSQIDAEKTANSEEAPDGGDWSEFDVDSWRSAVFKDKSFFAALYKDTTSFVERVVRDFAKGRKTSVIEVGTGTGEFIWPLVTKVDRLIGVDINPQFVDWCNTKVPPAQREKVLFLEGNATTIAKQVEPYLGKRDSEDEFRIVACVGNTMGIIPEELHTDIYNEMAELAGPNGVVLLVYWNADYFGEAIQKFYHPNPKLCGSVDGADIDWATTTMTTKSGYRTHWTGTTEARANFTKLGMHVHICEAQGKGVMVVASRNEKKLSSTVDPTFAGTPA